MKAFDSRLLLVEVDRSKPPFRYIRELKNIEGVQIEKTVGRFGGVAGIVIRISSKAESKIIEQIKVLEWVINVKEYKDVLLEVVIDD